MEQVPKPGLYPSPASGKKLYDIPEQRFNLPSHTVFKLINGLQGLTKSKVSLIKNTPIT